MAGSHTSSSGHNLKNDMWKKKYEENKVISEEEEWETSQVRHNVFHNYDSSQEHST